MGKVATFWRIEDFPADFQCRFGKATENHLDNALWTIPGEKMKNGKTSVKVLAQKAVEILSRREKTRSGKWVFPATKSTYYHGGRKPGAGHVVNIRKQLNKLRGAIGQDDIHPHDLRRTFGTWMLNAGESIETVSAALDHSSTAITQKVYAKILTARLRQGVSTLENFIDSKK